MSNSEQRIKRNTREELLFNPLQLFMFVESDSAQLETFETFSFRLLAHFMLVVTAAIPHSTTILKRQHLCPQTSSFLIRCQFRLSLFFVHHLKLMRQVRTRLSLVVHFI